MTTPHGSTISSTRTGPRRRRPPDDRGIRPGARRPPAGRAAHAGVVHAPGRPVAARVPRGARGRRDARVLPAPRPRHRDHPAAGAPPRRRRRDLLLRHRRPAVGHRCRPRHRRRRRPGRRAPGPHARRPRPAARPHARGRPRHHRVGAPARPPSSARPRSSASPGRRSRSRPTSSRAARRRTTSTPRPSCTATPQLWHDLCAQLAQISGAFLRVQAEAGASVVQLFDSWAGVLSRADYTASVQPHSAAALAAVADLDVPRIHFGVGTGELLALMGEAGADVVGVDYRVSLTDALARLGGRYAVQGNLDPALLFAPWEPLERRVRGDRRGGPGGAGPRLQPRPRRAARDRPRRADPGRRPRPRGVRPMTLRGRGAGARAGGGRPTPPRWSGCSRMPRCTGSPVGRRPRSASSRRATRGRPRGRATRREEWHTWVVRLGDDGPAVGYVQATVRPYDGGGGARLGRRHALAGARGGAGRGIRRPRRGRGLRGDAASSPTCTPTTSRPSGSPSGSASAPPTGWSTARSSGSACSPRAPPAASRTTGAARAVGCPSCCSTPGWPTAGCGTRSGDGLTAVRDTVRLDLRGFGDSTQRPSGPLDHVADVLATLDLLGIDACHLVAVVVRGGGRRGGGADPARPRALAACWPRRAAACSSRRHPRFARSSPRSGRPWSAVTSTPRSRPTSRRGWSGADARRPTSTPASRHPCGSCSAGRSR